jgi:hypothetical protein
MSSRRSAAPGPLGLLDDSSVELERDGDLLELDAVDACGPDTDTKRALGWLERQVEVGALRG